MAKTIKEERLRWILPIIKKELQLVDIAKVCPHSKRSLERWVGAYKGSGEAALEPKSTEPKTQPDETPIWIKERVIEVRKKTMKCALKIHWQLEKEGILIHPRTIGKILKKEGLVRKYRVKRIKYKYIKAERKPGELVEIDIKYVPGTIEGKEYFQYTAIDAASRWRHLEVFEEQSSYHSIKFPKIVMERFRYRIQTIKTDNHSTFTNLYTGTNKRSDMTVKTLHSLDVFCAKHNIIHYLIDRGKPYQNGTVERSHREDEEKFYQQNRFKDLNDLQTKLKSWNDYYKNLEHCGLNGKSPNEFLQNYQLTNPPNLCA
ncbi:MAG: DDE-type integrase/transposase/recombinase [Thermodesulfobacteriota bacterium]